MIWIMALLTFVAGILNVVQTGSNAELNRTIGQPLACGFIIAGANCVLYFALAPFFGFQAPQPKALLQVPWWAWLGGFCGAGSILCTILFARPLGSGVFTGLVVTASIITSVILDHYGVIGFVERPLTMWRTIGCVAMLVGLSLVATS